MSEFMGLIRGVYDAKADGFLPGRLCTDSFTHHCCTCLFGTLPDGQPLDACLRQEAAAAVATHFSACCSIHPLVQYQIQKLPSRCLPRMFRWRQPPFVHDSTWT
jgi:hypothetical protein